jgi:ABC-2 type transport system permease protein
VTDTATTPISTAAPERPSIWMTLSSLLRADATVTIKSRRSLLLSLLLPLILLFATRAEHPTAKLGGSTFVIGLSIAYGLAATGLLGYALTVARDRDQGVFQRLRVTPTPTWAIMGSRLATQVVANFIISIVVLIIGSHIHNQSVTAGEFLLVLAISIYASAVFLAIGQALVGLTKSADTVNAGGRILFGVLMFLGLFGASGVLGGGWESVSRWSPVGIVMRMFAAAQHVSGWSGTDSLSLLAGCGYIVVCGVVGILWFQWEAR